MTPADAENPDYEGFCAWLLDELFTDYFCEPDCMDLQDMGEKFGLFVQKTMDEPCAGPDDFCMCRDTSMVDFPTQCFRQTPHFAEVIRERNRKAKP